MCLDIDDVEDRVEELFDKLLLDPMFDTLLLFRSIRGKGLKWFVHINTERFDHRTWYNAVRNYLIITYKLTEKQADKSCANVSRACYVGYDENVFINKELIKDYKNMKEQKFNP